MEIAVQLVIAGILQGGVYALAAFGLSLIFGCPWGIPHVGGAVHFSHL
jgi:branched-subunit amino acid ABC-type transport system permease component